LVLVSIFFTGKILIFQVLVLIFGGNQVLVLVFFAKLYQYSGKYQYFNHFGAKITKLSISKVPKEQFLKFLL